MSVKVEITPQDEKQIDLLIKMIARAEFKLEGVEVIVASEAMKWLSRFQKQIIDIKANPISILTENAASSPLKKNKKG